MASERKYYWRRFGAIAFVLIVGGLIFYLFSPEDSQFFPQCPFHYLTGLDCPGCGSQRAIHHLLHFRFTEALRSNPLLVVAIPYVILGVYIEYFGGKEKCPRVKQLFYNRTAIIVVLIIIVLFWIGRNLF